MDSLGLARRTRGDFARRGRLVFAWQVLVQLVGVAAVAPLSGWLLNRVVARSGSPVVSNFDLAAFVLTPPGVVFVLLILLAAVAFHTAQFAGYTWIAGHAITRRPLTLWSTVGSVWDRIDVLVALGLRMCARVLLLTLPFVVVAAGAWFVLLREHDVNYYLAERPLEWRRWVMLVGALAVAYGVLVLRRFATWIFTMPLVMFARVDARSALSTSERMLRGRLLRTIAPLVAWWAALGVAAYATFLVGRCLTDAALGWAGLDVQRVLPLVAVFLAASLVVGFLYTTLQFAGHQFLITRAYAEREHASVLVPASVDAETDLIGRRQGKAITLMLVGTTILACGIAGVLFGRLELRGDVAVTAHRGASLQAPENTLAAFRAALAAGADCVELDVQRTRDGRLAVLHDADLMRVAGVPAKVREATLAELQRFDVGVRYGSPFAGERVPALEDVAALARGSGLKLNVELKYNVPDPGLAPAVVDLLRRERLLRDVVITSLDLAALRQVEQLAPEVPTGLIVTAAVGNVTRLDVDFVSLNSARAKPRLVRRLQARGKQVHVWTVNEPDVMLRMLERGVDNVITDDPARLVRLMRQRNALSTPQQLGLALRALFTETPPELRDERAVPAL